jgi:hypothetical protein
LICLAFLSVGHFPHIDCIMPVPFEAEWLRRSMVHVEAALKLIDPAYDCRSMAVPASP